MLELRKLTKEFGGLKALTNLDFRVQKGEIVGLIGPNGAGKTTVFNMVAGSLKPTQGRIFFQRSEITGMRPNKIAARGLVRTFQLPALVGQHSVLGNIMVAHHLQYSNGILGTVFRSRSARQNEENIRRKALDLLDSMELLEFKDELAGNLPHGLQMALGMGLALACKPKMLLLDEPTAGLSAAETVHIVDRIRQAREDGVTVMVIAHDLKVVMSLCDRIVAINFGQKIAEGRPEEIAKNKNVVSAYLGFKRVSRHEE